MGKKIHRAHLYHGNDDNFFRKKQKLSIASGPFNWRISGISQFSLYIWTTGRAICNCLTNLMISSAAEGFSTVEFPAILNSEPMFWNIYLGHPLTTSLYTMNQYNRSRMIKRIERAANILIHDSPTQGTYQYENTQDTLYCILDRSILDPSVQYTI